jgi:hypothetical protein
VTYAVVYGADRTIRRPQTATECLGLVKSLHSRAVPNIQIFDESGVEMRLLELEQRHQKEVESTYLVKDESNKRALPVRSSMRRWEQPRIEKAPSPGWLASFLLLTVTFRIAAAVAVRLLRDKVFHKDTA